MLLGNIKGKPWPNKLCCVLYFEEQYCFTKKDEP